MTDHLLPDRECPVHPILTEHWNDMVPPWKTVLGQGNPPTVDCPEIPVTKSGPAVTRTFGSNIQHISNALQSNAIFCGESLVVLRTLPSDFFTCCITSPPYWDTRLSGLVADRLGCEEDYREYIRNLVEVFREVRRTLRSHGTFWLVIGDTYASDNSRWWAMCKAKPEKDASRTLPAGFKEKDLMGIPWRLAMALQDDGWYLRSDIVWSIPNNLIEPVGDRPARAHEYVFLFTKSEEYTYLGHSREASLHRTVWEIPAVRNSPFDYAVFPELLVERCMRAGSQKGDTVLDPFFGSGTMGIVAKRLKRRYVGIDISADYVNLAAKRIRESEKPRGRVGNRL